MEYLNLIWCAIKQALTRNKRVETPSVTPPQFTHPPMDLKLKHDFVEDLSDGALD